MESSNEENYLASQSDTSRVDADNGLTSYSPSKRRILADLSPNAKVASTTPAFLKKSMAGSPLKRSFNAAIEGGDGFTYLKKRRLEDSEVLSELARETFSPGLDEIKGHGVLKSPSQAAQEPSPTEPNTPSEETDDSQGSSAERKSFSSLINYDPSSQTSNLVFKTISDAEMLRLRLRVAMYKVRTNQVDVPFTELQVESKLSQTPTQTAVEQAVAELRREAQEVAARQARQSIPKLLPAPVLPPTAYSSRFVYDTTLPSSPPASVSPDKLPTTVLTPLRDVRKLSSPSKSPHAQQKPSDAELTSSVVKGRVAEGLLGLRNAS